MVFRGRGGRPPRGRGFIGRGRARGRVVFPFVGLKKKGRSRSRSRSRSPSHSKHSRERPPSKDTRRRSRSRDRDSRDRHHRKEKPGRDSHAHYTEKRKKRDTDRSRSNSKSRSVSGQYSGRGDSYEKQHRSQSPSNDRSQGSPRAGYDDSPRHGHSQDNNSGEEKEEFYNEGPSGFYDDLDPPEIPGRSRWESPETGESPGQSQGENSTRRGQESSRQDHAAIRSQHGPKFRGGGVSSHSLHTESLRITVGNERFQGKGEGNEDKPLSAMDRLGPPVTQDFQPELDDLYQDLPPPAVLPSITQQRKDPKDYGNTTLLRDEKSQKHREQAPTKGKVQNKYQSRSDNAAHRGSSIDKDKTQDKGKDKGKEGRRKRSKERDLESDKGKSSERQHGHAKRRGSKETDFKGQSREESYSHERENKKDYQHSQFPSSSHRQHGKRQPGGVPQQVHQNPSVDLEFNQATLLVQTIRQGTNRAAVHQPSPGVSGGSQPMGSSGGHPPHTVAPFAQQLHGGADGMYPQSSQSGYSNLPGEYYQQQQQQHQHQQQHQQHQQQQQQQQQQHQQQPHQYETQLPSHPYPPGSSHLPTNNPPIPLHSTYKSHTPSTEYHSGPPQHSHDSGSLLKVEAEKKLDVNFGSTEEEDLFLYGDLGDDNRGIIKSNQKMESTENFWKKIAGPPDAYTPEVKLSTTQLPNDEEQNVTQSQQVYETERLPTTPPKQVPEKQKSTDMEDDQIKKILSVIGFDFDLAQKIADQKKQQQEEEELRRQARASKKPSVRPAVLKTSRPPQTSKSESSQVIQSIQSLAGHTQSGEGQQHDNWENPPSSSFNPTSSFLDSGLHTATETDSSLDSFVHDAKQNVTQSQLAYQPERMPAPQPQGPPVHGGYQHGLMPPPPPQFDQYGRPLLQLNLPPPVPPPGFPLAPVPFYPQPQPHMHPGVTPHLQGFVPQPTTQPQPYYIEQSGPQYQQPPHQEHQLYERQSQPSVASGSSSTFNHPSDAYQQQSSQAYQQQSPQAYHQHSPEQYSNSSSGNSEISSSGSESPERTPPKRSRDRSRSHSHSIREGSHQGDKEEYGPEPPLNKDVSPRRIVHLPKSEYDESNRKRKYEDVKDLNTAGKLDKLKDLERGELKKLRQLYKDEREALDKKKRKEEEKEKALEEKKIQQAIKRKEAERRKERAAEEKKRQAVAKKKQEEEARIKKREEKERKEDERKLKEEHKQHKIKEAQERARQIKLSQDKYVYSKRLEALESALSRLRKQEGELLRKKQREKAGHKDPILVENSKLQDEIANQLKDLRVAFTEGRVQHIKFEETVFTEEVKLREKAFDKMIADADARKAKERDEKKGSKSSKSKITLTDEEKAERQPFQFTYTDPGSHWCKLCKLSLQSLNNLFIHLHSKKHMQKCDPYCRPWVPDDLTTKKPKGSSVVSAPLGGAEFMMPVNAFYCKLCREFSGDGFCASEHLKSVKHNVQYQKFTEENPGYVKKLELERAADENPSDIKVGKEKNENSEGDKDSKKEDKGKIKVDIGQRGGFGKFRFLKKEDDKTTHSKNETKEIKKEVNIEPETLELRKSEPAKQQSQLSKDKESSTGKDAKKDGKITIKISTGRQFVPHSVVKPTSVPPPPPPKVAPVMVKPLKTSPHPNVGKVKSPVAFTGNADAKGKPVFKAGDLQGSIKNKSKGSLGSFLSIGGQALPVIKEVEKKIPSQDQIAEAFSGKKTNEQSTAKLTAKAPKPEEKGDEDTQKPSFSDTLRKMLFSSTQKEVEKSAGSSGNQSLTLPQPEKKSELAAPPPVPAEAAAPKSVAAPPAINIFDLMFSGNKELPRIPGIDDDDELKPPGT